MPTKLRSMETCPIGVPVIAFSRTELGKIGTRINAMFVEDQFPRNEWSLETYSGWLPLCQWIDAKKVKPPEDGNLILVEQQDGLLLKMQWDKELEGWVDFAGYRVTVSWIEAWCYAPDEYEESSLPPNVSMKIDLDDLYRKLEAPTCRADNRVLRSVVRRCRDAEKALAAISELARKEGNNAPNK